MIEQTLHGLVVGLGKIRKDGSKEFRWLDKPIHNRIVSGGLDYWLTYNGSNSAIKTSDYHGVSLLRRGSSAEGSGYYTNWSGPLQYMSVGTNGDATAFSDASLKSQVGGYSESSLYSTTPYCGMMVTHTTNIVKYRFNYVSVSMSEATTIREIGFHGKYYGQNIYPLFSRVVLPEPVELDAGEALIAVYQMNITFPDLNVETEVNSGLLSGLLDSDGNPLRGMKKMPISGFNNYFNIWVTNYIGTRPVAIIGTGSSSAVKAYTVPMANDERWDGPGGQSSIPWEISSYPSRDTHSSTASASNALGYTLVSTYRYNDGTESQYNDDTRFWGNTRDADISVRDYVPGTYYRDVELTLHQAWPYFNGEQYLDIYAIRYYGVVIRFGHYDNTDPSNPVWVPKPWRKQFGQSYKFTFRYKLSTADTV